MGGERKREGAREGEVKIHGYELSARNRRYGTILRK